MKDAVNPSIYPETRVGGFSRHDGTIEFYNRVTALIRSSMTVLNLGAGRGAYLEDSSPRRRELQSFKGRVERVIGLDVDPAIAQNTDLDEALVYSGEEAFPLPSASVDLIVSDWTFEHIAQPALFASEIVRVLRPGGWLCARTPNRHGYISVAARIIPASRHSDFLARLQPRRQRKDVFPGEYALNTRGDLERYFPPPVMDLTVYPHTPELAYVAGSARVRKILNEISRMAPARLAPVLHIFGQRTGSSSAGPSESAC